MTERTGITVAEVSVNFGGFMALADVSVQAPPGVVTGLVGPNGAGKSTLFNVITSVVKPTHGRVFVDGEDLTGLSSHAIAQRGIARTFQAPRGFPSLSVLDNVLVAADHPNEGLIRSLLGGKHPPELRERAMWVLERVGLVEHADAQFGRLSAGEARLLEVGRHLLRDPHYVLLDEPTAGVAPELQDRLSELLLELRSEGRTLVCVEHNMKFLRDLADHVVVLETGQVIAEGAPATVFNDERVVTAYLGERGRAHAAG